MAEIFTVENLTALVALASLEIVLGIDNLVFLAVLADKLPPERRPFARRLGLILAMAGRIALLLVIAWLVTILTSRLFTAFGHEFTGKDLILLLGGLFLVGKGTFEIHHMMEGETHEKGREQKYASFASVIAQIVLMDLVFSLDSVITAVGMTQTLWVMVAAIVIAIGVMLAFAGSVARFVERHPTMKMLALSFLILVGVLLVADGIGQHIPRGYIYFAMAFSLMVELLNMAVRKKRRKRRGGKPPADAFRNVQSEAEGLAGE